MSTFVENSYDECRELVDDGEYYEIFNRCCLFCTLTSQVSSTLST